MPRQRVLVSTAHHACHAAERGFQIGGVTYENVEPVSIIAIALPPGTLTTDPPWPTICKKLIIIIFY